MNSISRTITIATLTAGLAGLSIPAQSQSPVTPSSIPKPVCNQPIQGFVDLRARQTVGFVTVRVDGAYVTAGGTYRVNVTVENGSNVPFSFVPTLNAAVRDANTGQAIGAGLRFFSDGGVYLQSRQRLRGELTIYSRCWQTLGPQGLVLLIRESGTGSRAFQIPF